MSVSKLAGYLSFDNVQNIRSARLSSLLLEVATSIHFDQDIRRNCRLKAAVIRNIIDQKGYITLFDLLLIVSDLNLTTAREIKNRLVYYSTQRPFHLPEKVMVIYLIKYKVTN